MKFKRLDLTGFKSFVEKTSINIEKGLTGIVGPNGCGKSNIVESIRWCMGESSAKSMRGTGMEDIIFSGTANKVAKNIAEVSLILDNSDKEGPNQYKELDIINVKRRIQKDKGSRYFINDKEMRARDIQTLFADLSTGAHSPSMISQGRIGALVTAKPTDRRAILEEAAGISGIHVRRHESELRLNSAENNLKKADDLRRQQEKQLENLKKQAIEASKYKLIAEEIKKIEAGLYYIKFMEIEGEINSTKNITGESDNEVNLLRSSINEENKLLEEVNLKLKPLRDQNVEILSKLQRLNLEFQNLEDEEKRIKNDKDRLIKSQNTLFEDIDREKNIILEARSNEKRLDEEKNVLISTEEKYYDLEKKTENDLQTATTGLKENQEYLEKISKNLVFSSNTNGDLLNLKESLSNLEKSQDLINNGNIEEASTLINKTRLNLKGIIESLESTLNKNTLDEFNSTNSQIKISQEKYANAFSKNQSIKTDSIKRRERIKNIDIEIQNWKNLKFNSEKMQKELNERMVKVKNDLEKLEKLPENIAEKKGRLTQNTSDTKKNKNELEDNLIKLENEYQKINKKLKDVEQKMIVARENKARSGATLEGLENRKKDLRQKFIQ